MWVNKCSVTFFFMSLVAEWFAYNKYIVRAESTKMKKNTDFSAMWLISMLWITMLVIITRKFFKQPNSQTLQKLIVCLHSTGNCTRCNIRQKKKFKRIKKRWTWIRHELGRPKADVSSPFIIHHPGWSRWVDWLTLKENILSIIDVALTTTTQSTEPRQSQNHKAFPS